MRIGVDIGGTFTDVVVFDEARNEITLAKALSTPQELARGVQEGLLKAGAPLAQASFLIHGSTIVVNAIIERRGAKTALVTTKGFRDVYEIGRINRPESFNLRFRKHRPLVPRELIFEVPERLMADGSVYVPFDEGKAREVAQVLAEGVVFNTVGSFSGDVSDLFASHLLPGGEFYKFEENYPADERWYSLMTQANQEFDLQKRASIVKEWQRLTASKMYFIPKPGAGLGYNLQWPWVANRGVFVTKGGAAQTTFLRLWLDQSKKTS